MTGTSPGMGCSWTDKPPIATPVKVSRPLNCSRSGFMAPVPVGHKMSPTERRIGGPTYHVKQLFAEHAIPRRQPDEHRDSVEGPHVEGPGCDGVCHAGRRLPIRVGARRTGAPARRGGAGAARMAG